MKTEERNTVEMTQHGVGDTNVVEVCLKMGWLEYLHWYMPAVRAF